LANYLVYGAVNESLVIDLTRNAITTSPIIEKIIKWLSRESDNHSVKVSITLALYKANTKNYNYLLVRVHITEKNYLTHTVYYFMLIFFYLNCSVVIFVFPQWLLILHFRLIGRKSN